MSVPKKVYTNQRFEVVVKAFVTNRVSNTFSTKFSNAKNVKILNPTNKWKKTSNNTYENRYIFKVNNKTFRMPNIKVTVYTDNSSILDVSVLASKYIAYSNISKTDNRFSNLIANNVQLKAYKTKQYNNDDALTLVDIDATKSNLENFKLQDVIEQGVTKLNDNISNQNLIYYFVTPAYQKKLVFTYFDPSSKNFREVTIPLILQNELVSTQTDLNPNDSSFEKYKKIATLVAFIIFLLLFIWKRKKFLLIISLILLVITIIYYMPNSKGVVKKDSYIYILPTKKSTIFFKLDSNQRVEKLQERNGFVKVIGIDNKFIGWVKESSFGKD